MKIKEIMGRNVETIHPSESLQSAAHRMETLNTTMLAVVEADMPIGVVSERDIITRGVALGLDPKMTRVREVMAMNVESVSEDEDVERALHLMEEKHLGGLIVRDAQERLAGVVTLDAIAQEAMTPELSGAGAGPAPGPPKVRPR